MVNFMGHGPNRFGILVLHIWCGDKLLKKWCPIGAVNLGYFGVFVLVLLRKLVILGLIMRGFYTKFSGF